ncbi:hypothetical protein RJ639_023103 [Escallonia herrerae]|uniref:Ripening-related protein 1 n=1 Tax=Escallonia herrerae TaxID=1293975 RepID=A0AA88UZ75_9ASTE|nr:hypothetical protein RJ639_023103 [Escallonia herrerae]
MDTSKLGSNIALVVLLLTHSADNKAQACRPSGRIRGIKPLLDSATRRMILTAGKFYTTYTCSPPVSTNTKAMITLNSFQKGGDGGGPSECDNQYHSDDTPVMALSTAWYSVGGRCHNNIVVSANGRSVRAMVVDECNSTMGCDEDHDYQPPCPNDIVDALKAVWKALGVPEDNWGESMETFKLGAFLIVLLVLLVTHSVEVKAQSCKPSGKIRGIKPPHGQCNEENDSVCCVRGKFYTTYTCSPSVSNNTKATLTLNSFQKGGDGGGPSECDNQYHSDDTPVVALSTGWYSGGGRCHNHIIISGNGRSVRAMVVDECDSTVGCDKDHDYQPPCPNNIVDASKAVWKALGIPLDNWGELDITWSDA